MLDEGEVQYIIKKKRNGVLVGEAVIPKKYWDAHIFVTDGVVRTKKIFYRFLDRLVKDYDA